MDALAMHSADISEATSLLHRRNHINNNRKCKCRNQHIFAFIFFTLICVMTIYISKSSTYSSAKQKILNIEPIESIESIESIDANYTDDAIRIANNYFETNYNPYDDGMDHDTNRVWKDPCDRQVPPVNPPPPGGRPGGCQHSTASPSNNPTKIATNVPTYNGNMYPTRLPTLKPTKVPTFKPTTVPTFLKLTKAPTLKPTKAPILKPTKAPTLKPTNVPTTDLPTTAPTITKEFRFEIEMKMVINASHSDINDVVIQNHVDNYINGLNLTTDYTVVVNITRVPVGMSALETDSGVEYQTVIMIYVRTDNENDKGKIAEYFDGNQFDDEMEKLVEEEHMSFAMETRDNAPRDSSTSGWDWKWWQCLIVVVVLIIVLCGAIYYIYRSKQKSEIDEINGDVSVTANDEEKLITGQIFSG